MCGSGKEFCECPYCHNYALKHMSKEKYSLMFGDERMKIAFYFRGIPVREAVEGL